MTATMFQVKKKRRKYVQKGVCLMTVLSSEADFCVHGAQMAARGESSPETIERTGRRKEKKLIKPREDREGGAQKGKEAD